jgi:hypothetical protein
VSPVMKFIEAKEEGLTVYRVSNKQLVIGSIAPNSMSARSVFNLAHADTQSAQI